MCRRSTSKNKAAAFKSNLLAFENCRLYHGGPTGAHIKYSSVIIPACASFASSVGAVGVPCVVQ